MNDKKIISMIFKTLNYTNEIKRHSSTGSAGRRQLFKTLRHSLRIPTSQPKKLEWIDDQSHLNLIWLPEVGIVKLDDYSKEEREALLTKITNEAEAPTVVNKDRGKLLELRTKLKNSVKNASKKESDEWCISSFQRILNVKGSADTVQLLSDLSQFDINRKAQKLNTARQFLDCHNEIESGPKALIRKNQAVVQEAFFKFPSRNEVSGINPENRIDLIKGFYQAVFPEYPIHFIVLHGDEDKDKRDYSDHPHLFISTKNSKSGRYDLRETQIKKVNAYLKKHRPGTDPISETPDFLESQLLFGYLQDMFYVYTNNRLLKQTPYVAKKVEQTEAHMQKLRYIRNESKKPKSERAFNLYELARVDREEAQRQAESAKEEAQQAQQQRQEAFQKAKKAKAFTDQQISTAKEAISVQQQAERATSEGREQAQFYQRKTDNFKQTLANKNTEYAKIQSEIEQKTKELRLFKTNLSDLIDGIIGWLEEFFTAKRKAVQDLHLEKARHAYARIEENDKTCDKIFTIQADHEIDHHLDILDNHSDSLPDLPKPRDIKRLIKP
ncbi:hypothetical protein ACI77N_05105 [Pseudomonas sp. S191]|uniref:hypothetical protein n=1 Tax=Pseudomonas sp. S191 TaxID=579575 RepID=UPI00387B1929